MHAAPASYYYLRHNLVSQLNLKFSLKWGITLHPYETTEKLKILHRYKAIIPWHTQQAENKRKNDVNEESY